MVSAKLQKQGLIEIATGMLLLILSFLILIIASFLYLDSYGTCLCFPLTLLAIAFVFSGIVSIVNSFFWGEEKYEKDFRQELKKSIILGLKIVLVVILLFSLFYFLMPKLFSLGGGEVKCATDPTRAYSLVYGYQTFKDNITNNWACGGGPMPPSLFPSGEYRGKCESSGGVWRVGHWGDGHCDFSFQDAGKECRDSSECEGSCVIKDESNTYHHDDNFIDEYKKKYCTPVCKGVCSKYPIRFCDWPFEGWLEVTNRKEEYFMHNVSVYVEKGSLPVGEYKYEMQNVSGYNPEKTDETGTIILSGFIC